MLANTQKQNGFFRSMSIKEMLKVYVVTDFEEMEMNQNLQSSNEFIRQLK